VHSARGGAHNCLQVPLLYACRRAETLAPPPPPRGRPRRQLSSPLLCAGAQAAAQAVWRSGCASCASHPAGATWIVAAAARANKDRDHS
jgi:hypothetical protein